MNTANRYIRPGNPGKGAGLLALPLVVTLLLSGCDAQGQTSTMMPPPPAVDVAEVLADDITLWNSFTGRLAAPETVALRPRVSGYIDRVSFEEGEAVEQGQVLFVIDQRPYQARLRAAEADLAYARSRLALATREAERAGQLLGTRAISQEEHDQRRAALDGAQASLDAAEAAADTARLDLEYTEVRSPVSGRAGRAQITRGNMASADSTLLTTVVSLNPVHVYFESNQHSALENARPEAGQQVPVRVALGDDGRFAHHGHLDFIDNQLNHDTGTLQYRAVLDNADGRLRPGQFVRVEMPQHAARHAVLVDQKAVLTDQNRRFVYVLGDENRAERRNITTGRRVDGLVVVHEGLSPGDRIIVNGIQKVFYSGMEVAPQDVNMRSNVPQVASAP